MRASPNGSACFILALHSLCFEVTQNDAPQSVGFPWTRCQLVTETSTSTSHTSYLPSYEDGTERVPKRRHIKFRRRRITQNKAYNNRPLPDNTHNTHNRQTSMPPVGFKPTIPTGERPQTYALDRAATGTGVLIQGVPGVMCQNSGGCSLC